ncbi:MAG TPA: hypothetical protein DD490_34530, partial [Acidobacteria bacterium]|nr:hypothetical protein [Acidobacteriota bacterium]
MARIVVVDDAPEIVTTVSQMLQSAGHSVEAVPADQQTETRIGEEHPDLVLLD